MGNGNFQLGWVYKVLRKVGLRCSLERFLEQAGIILALAGIIAIIAVLLERLFGLQVLHAYSITGFSVVTATVIVLRWWTLRPSPMEVALLIDEQLNLKERFSSTLAFAKEENDPFARATCIEACRQAEHLEIKGQFPIRCGSGWYYTAGVWLVTLGLFFLLPQKDLLGFLKKKQEQQKQQQQLQQVNVELQKSLQPVKMLVKKVDKKLADELQSLDKLPTTASPAQIKRQAIKKLGNLADTIKNLQDSSKLAMLQQMQEMLRKLRGSPEEFSRQLRQALAQGKFSQASRLIEQLQNQLKNSNLTEQQRQDITRQLQELGKQLQEISRLNKDLEKLLQKEGLDKKLTKLSVEQLRKILQKKGMSKEKIEQLLKKIAACRSAANCCNKLGQAMAAAGMSGAGLNADELAELADQISEIDTLQEDMKSIQAALDEIEKASTCLGKGLGEGLGMKGLFSKGLSNRSGPGTGGPGKGLGRRDTADSGKTSHKQTRLKNKSEPGPVVASWYFQGTQIKGQARRQYSQVIQAARDSAAAAISENQIPRRYENAIKTYFGQLDRTTETSKEPDK